MSDIKKMELVRGDGRVAIFLVVLFYPLLIYVSNEYWNSPLLNRKIAPQFNSSPPTNVNDLLFGLVGSEKAWKQRKPYIESWWRVNITRGFIFLDRPPRLPWSPSSPPYKISDDLSQFLNRTHFTAQRIIHAIAEVYREENRAFRWLVMGDDDSVFFVDNMVEVLAGYDHTKKYYFGGHSEFIVSNHWHSFSQGFGGGGIILSYPLAKSLAESMENCLDRYRHLDAADHNTMACIADFGVTLTSLKGIHQVDLRGDISGFLSSHPNSPVMSLHHFDKVDPIFPSMDRAESTRHLMKASAADHSRMLQQTICHHRPSNWSFSISWGYSAHIYERIMPRSYLQCPIETFKRWRRTRPPHYMFNTRLPSTDPCEAPHVFFYQTIETTPENQILTVFSRAWPRGLPACSFAGNHFADFVSKIHVYSPTTKRFHIDRSECCDIVGINGEVADVKFRECTADEIIA